MKKIILLSAIIGFAFFVHAQDDVYPAKTYKGLLFITNGTVHVGNGQVLENTTIAVNDGKIVRLGKDLPIPQDDVKVINAKGKQV
ncbi:MAG TPA: amidohydrolase, partial [Agriterribacter sp.]|nr:amidohydrolase [Agriterribacter sp.]